MKCGMIILKSLLDRAFIVMKAKDWLMEKSKRDVRWVICLLSLRICL
jgi:hypothetical protein